jgi:ribosomal protein S18 acetylase RimI-like enzyme
MTFTFRRAEPADLATVRSILESRVGWLHEHGYDQWSERDPGRDTQRSVNNGNTWLLLEDDYAVATLTMTTVADPDFWTAADLAQPALYLSKLATRPDVGGRGLGALLVECANRYASARGISRLRWDVWRTNASLQAYYKRLGARHVRTVEVRSRSSGALFEWAFRVPHIPAHVTIDAPTHVLAEVRSTMHHPLDLANDRSSDYVTPAQTIGISPATWARPTSDRPSPRNHAHFGSAGKTTPGGPFSTTLEQAGWRTATGRTRRRARCSID